MLDVSRSFDPSLGSYVVRPRAFEQSTTRIGPRPAREALRLLQHLDQVAAVVRPESRHRGATAGIAAGEPEARACRDRAIGTHEDPARVYDPVLGVFGRVDLPG